MGGVFGLILIIELGKVFDSNDVFNGIKFCVLMCVGVRWFLVIRFNIEVELEILCGLMRGICYLFLVWVECDVESLIIWDCWVGLWSLIIIFCYLLLILEIC